VIVVVLLTIVYSIALSNINFNTTNFDYITLKNIKQKLEEFEFKNQISVKCTQKDELECFVFKDGEMDDNTLENLFEKCPTVYSYSRNYETIEFKELKFDDLDTRDVCFEFNLHKTGKYSQMVVETLDDEIYIYDGISQQAKKIKYISDLGFYFDEKQEEVRDAF
jgi:hypothetical protein